MFKETEYAVNILPWPPTPCRPLRCPEAGSP